MWTVYRCDKIQHLQAPRNEVRVGGEYPTAGKAMDEANRMARADRKHSYTVGPA